MSSAKQLHGSCSRSRESPALRASHGCCVGPGRYSCNKPAILPPSRPLSTSTPRQSGGAAPAAARRRGRTGPRDRRRFRARTPPSAQVGTMEIIHDVDQPRQETRTCRICNEVGHLARNCPQAPPREETRKCHICGEVGHIARYCPENTGDGGARRETRKCHVCGEVGHLARNCPNAEDGGDYDGGEGAAAGAARAPAAGAASTAARSATSARTAICRRATRPATTAASRATNRPSARTRPFLEAAGALLPAALDEARRPRGGIPYKSRRESSTSRPRGSPATGHGTGPRGHVRGRGARRPRRRPAATGTRRGSPHVDTTPAAVTRDSASSRPSRASPGGGPGRRRRLAPLDDHPVFHDPEPHVRRFDQPRVVRHADHAPIIPVDGVA